ncbi:MAG: GNAT family N-acetyltransferase [Candidatus Heimdallarchaeota archaeon]|nr:GNAT family N-acetyltransferase [Candidatus Heimdallarchaeota archaeon]MCK4954233.1 GNAT family N-acetyltransferase [Candidatus Heimdallarchaeota archaeon]
MSELPGKITIFEPKMAAKAAEMFNAFNEIWPGGFGGAVPFDEQRVHDMLDKTSAVADLVALDENDDLVGYCGVYPHWRDEDAAYISIIGVHPRVQGKKFGKRLLLKSLEVAKEKGIARVDLHTWSGNMEAVPLYKKVGLFWVPDTSVYMQDFIPGILQFPLAIDWFEKHPDWYGCFKRELLQAPDKTVVEGMNLYTYVFEVDEDKLAIEIDRYGWGITGFNRTLNGKRIFINIRLASHEIHMGIENSMTINVENESGKTVILPLNIESFKGLEWKEVFPSTLEISQGEKKSLTREFIVDKNAKPFKNNQRGSEVIKTNLEFDGNKIQLVTGAKIQESIKLESPDSYQVVPLGNEITVYIDLLNKTNIELKGEIDYRIKGLIKETQTIDFSLMSEELSGITLPLSIPHDSKETVYTIQATPRIRINGSDFEMPEYNFPLIADVPELSEIVVSPDPDVIYMLTDFWSLRVSLEGGNLIIQRRDLESGTQRSSFEIGPPFGLDLDRSVKYEYELVTNEKGSTLILTADSRKAKGLRIYKHLRVKPGLREIEHWIELENIGKEGTIAAGGKTRAGKTSGLSVNPFGEFARTIIPVNEKYIESDPTLPILSSTLVPQESEMWQETWTAAEILSDSRYNAWFWKPENMAKIYISKGYLERLESNVQILEAGEKMKVVHLWYGDSYSSLSDIRNRWSQLISHKDIPAEEKKYGIQTILPINCNLTSSYICEVGEIVEKTVEFEFATAYPFTGELSLILPKDWNGAFITEEGEQKTIQMPQPVPYSPIPVEVRLELPQEYSKSTELLRLHLSGEFELDFDIPLIVIGKKEVTIEEGEIKDHKIWKIDNGALQFSVPKEIGGNLIKLQDRENRSFLEDNFPEIKPFFFVDYFSGGIQTLYFSFRDENPSSKPEITKTEIIEEGKWKGIKSTWTVENMESLKGQTFSLTYLTLPESNLIRIKMLHDNDTPRRLKFIAALVTSLSLQGDAKDTIIKVPGGIKTWIRNRVQKPFQNLLNLNEPWVRLSKGDQSLTMISPEGFHVGNTIFDAQMAIFSLMVSILETKPDEKSEEEIILALNQPEDAIYNIKKALARK